MKPALRVTRVAFVSGTSILAVISAIGCRIPDPIEVWQQKLTDHIAGQGNWNPGVLREAPTLRSTASLRPAEIRFSATGIPGPAFGFLTAVRDVQGVLVGLWSDHDPTSYVFLIGVNEHHPSGRWELLDVRPIALFVREKRVHWFIGPEQRRALTQYLSATPPSDRQIFPRLDDEFRMEVQGDHLIIHEVKSGALWQLNGSPTAQAAP